MKSGNAFVLGKVNRNAINCLSIDKLDQNIV